MGLPFTFLAGLLVLFANRELMPPVSGSGRWEVLAPCSLLLALPTVLAAFALRQVRRRLCTGRRAFVPPRSLLRLSRLATPLSTHVVLAQGGWADIGSWLAGASHLADILLLLLPLFLAEVPRIPWATAAEVHLEIAQELGTGRRLSPSLLPGLRELWPVVRSRLSWPLLLAMPCGIFGLVLDLLQLDRSLYVFFFATTPGATAGTLLFLAIASALLPWWFRIAFGVVSTLPEPVGTRLRATAVALGFPASRVLFLPTGDRAMNAMMVGPLPMGRFLCVTDGLVRMLDADSLAGVVAHEVGHARKGHPLILMSLAVVVPLLLPAPLRLLDLHELDATSQALLVVGGALLVWTVVRALARRFEHEADTASVRALGAAPCTRALRVVAEMAMAVPQGWLRRHFSLHPEEESRWSLMRRYESEPAFRAAFDARGRLLRRTAAAAIVGAAAMAGYAWTVEWPFEQAVWRFHVGDFVQARKLVEAVGDDVPERWQKPWARLREDLAVAVELAPDADHWTVAREAIDASAWRRGVQVLLRAGPQRARPWFALAMEAETRPDLVRHAVFEFCEAAAEEDVARMAEAKDVVRRLGVPAELAPVFRD